jgi:hypothetical protein
MKRLLTGFFVGIVIGSVGGQLALLLSPFWNVALAFVSSAALAFWGIRTMRELDRQKEIIDEILATLPAPGVSPFSVIQRRPRKDLGPPLQ